MVSWIKKLRYWIRCVFSFSQTETTGFLTLTVLMVLMLCLLLLLEFFLPSTVSGYASDKAKLDSLMALIVKESDDKKQEEMSKLFAVKPLSIEAFDPNQIRADQWQDFGLPKHLADRISKYRDKGGKFRVKRDLLKIYGFPQSLYNQLYSYILLPDSITYSKNAEEHENLFVKQTSDIKKFAASYEKKDTKLSRFNLNSADTTQLKLIKGIGPALSRRIIKYRDLLGGFASTEQIREIYGLDSTVVDELLQYGYLSENASLQKININSATVEELDAHPYISPKAAKVIVAYREQHGKFTSPESVYEIRVLDKNTLEKLTPYLSFQ